MTNFDLALRATEIMLAMAFFQQCAEHIIASPASRWLFVPRILLSALLISGVKAHWATLGLSVHSLLILRHYNGPYNGGSDRMGLLVLYCLCLAHWLPDGLAQQAAFGYLAVQVVLSYVISGQVKIVNPEWRSGRALRDVFEFSAYPVTENLRLLAHRPRTIWAASWAVMLFEILFPLAFVTPHTLVLALCIAALFHLGNAVLFGLNRFVWFWIAAYPSILWLQTRIMAI